MLLWADMETSTSLPQQSFENVVDRTFVKFARELGLKCMPESNAKENEVGRACMLNFSGRTMNGNIVLSVSAEILEQTMPKPKVPSQDWLNEMGNRFVGRLEAAMEKEGEVLTTGAPVTAASRTMGRDYGTARPPLVYRLDDGTACLWITQRRQLSKVSDPVNMVDSSRPRVAPWRPRADRQTVLVVDDAQSARAPARQALEGAGHRVLEAQSGHEALRILKTQSDIGLVFSDLHMSGGTGLELVKAIRSDEALAGMPVVVITAASGSGSDVTQVKQLGVSLVMLKPVAASALTKVAKRYLTGL